MQERFPTEARALAAYLGRVVWRLGDPLGNNESLMKWVELDLFRFSLLGRFSMK